jgi:hypothetical protein
MRRPVAFFGSLPAADSLTFVTGTPVVRASSAVSADGGYAAAPADGRYSAALADGGYAVGGR